MTQAGTLRVLEAEPMVSMSRCAGCLNLKINSAVLCQFCIAKSNAISHVLEGHSDEIDGCKMCRDFSAEMRRRLGLT